MATATVSYRAEIKDLRAKLASIPDITRAEARKMVTELNRSMRAVERQNKQIASSFKGVGESAGDAESSIRAISGAIGMVDPQAEKLLNVFAELGGATEGVTRGAEVLGVATMPALATGLAAVSAAVTIGYAAWNAYTVEQRLAEKAAKDLKTALASVEAAQRRVTDAIRESQRATGEITDAEATYQRQVEAAADARDRDIESLIKQSGYTREQVENTRKLMSAEGDHTRALASMDQGLVLTATHVNALNTAYERQVESLQKTKDATDEAKGAKDEERGATSSLIDVKRDANEVDAEALRLIRERSAASDRLAAISARSSLVVLEGEARVNEEYRRRLAQIAELERVSGDHINADVARATSRLEFEKRLADLRERNAAKTAAQESRLAQQTERARQQAMQESMDLAGQLTSTISAGASATYDRQVENLARLQDYQARSSEYLTEHQKKQLDERVKDQRRAAANAFNASQAAASADAAVQTALAVSKALAAAPPPFNFVLAGTALAGGLAQQAAIQRAQPAFHQGGEVLAPDEQQAVVRAREFVLNPTGREMMGDDALERANAGQSPRGGGEVVAVSVYKHTRQVDRWKRDGLNAGDPIARAIDRGRLVGLRSNR